MTRFLYGLACALFLAAGGPARAAQPLEVVDAWARATVPGQSVGGVYMELRAHEDMRLTGVRTAAAESAQIHRMSMENGMMRMRPVPFLVLPAGKSVKLAPGGYHIMLFDLKNSLVEGQKLRLELIVEDAAKARQTIPVEAVIRERDAGVPGAHGTH
ncbi:MAG TPA: copper chaperone PCu(A)C [Burkholderiales bacterium]|nr:copper chaperone PCu(A)C [Burkholderiales bacterium]